MWLDPFLQFSTVTGTSEDLKQKWKLILKLGLQNSTYSAAMEFLLSYASPIIIKHIVD